MILFNSKSDFYSEFSNFAPFPIVIGNQEYPTMEHYYQSQKFISQAYAERIRNARTASDAKRLGASKEYPIYDDWSTHRLHVMMVGLVNKFNQHKVLRDMLIRTGDKELVHLSPWDKYWGVDKKGNGKNYLGKILMKIREELSQHVGDKKS